MQSGRQVHPGANADVRAPRDIEQVGQLGDPAPLGDAPGATDIGQDDVRSAATELVVELPAVALGLAAGDGHVHRGAEGGVALDVLGRERVLEPADARLLHPPRGRDHRAGIVAAMGIDQQLPAPAESRGDGLHLPQILLHVGAPYGELYRRKPVCQVTVGGIEALLQGGAGHARGVAGHARRAVALADAHTRGG